MSAILKEHNTWNRENVQVHFLLFKNIPIQSWFRGRTTTWKLIGARQGLRKAKVEWSSGTEHKVVVKRGWSRLLLKYCKNNDKRGCVNYKKSSQICINEASANQSLIMHWALGVTNWENLAREIVLSNQKGSCTSLRCLLCMSHNVKKSAEYQKTNELQWRFGTFLHSNQKDIFNQSSAKGIGT